MTKTIEPEATKPLRMHRVAYAAAHLVMKDEYRATTVSGYGSDLASMIDWDATLDIRRYLNGLEFGIAEAMDTAQRFEVGWDIARMLIEKTIELDLALPPVAGAGYDHVEHVRSKNELIDAVAFQVDFIHNAGGIPILLPLLWLTETGAGEEEYVEVYREIIQQSRGPLLLHWLGPEFLAATKGYFPGESFNHIMEHDPEKVLGAKISLLDPDREEQLRLRALERRQVILTGDDWNFARLIAGKDPTVRGWRSWGPHEVALGDFSHALLGILDAIAEPARVALKYLEEGNSISYQKVMAPCEALSRVIFEPPTEHY
ncbi:MAG: DUF993 family protein, partial [Aeoliella sp.]